MMPVVIIIVFMVLNLFLSGVNDSIIMGDTYTALYSYYGDFDIEKEAERLEKTMAEDLTKNGYIESVTISCKPGDLGIYVADMYGDSEAKHFSREYNVCTERLRRWQMYGDIISE